MVCNVWCKVRIEAQGKDDPNVSMHDGFGATPQIFLDYKELSDFVETAKKKIMPWMVRGKWTTLTATFVVPAKGSIEETKRAFDAINASNYDTISFKCDSGDSIEVARDEASTRRTTQTTPTDLIPHHLGTHGVVEDVVQDVIAQFGKRVRLHSSSDLDAPPMWILRRWGG